MNHRFVTRAPLLAGISEGTLSLDASGSYDPDSGKTTLTVVWSCAVVKENNWDPGVCGGNLTEDATISQPLAAYGAGTYAFSAFVVSADGRNTSTSVVIEVRGGAGALMAAVRNYVAHFFGCEHCRVHFLAMYDGCEFGRCDVPVVDSPDSQRAVVMWFW